MNQFNKTMLTADIESSMKLASTVKIAKIVLALIIVLAYFTNFSWLYEIIIIAVIINLLLPIGFFDVFIQKLLEYNTQKVEERVILNAEETNNYFTKNDIFKEYINKKISELNEKSYQKKEV